MARVLDFQSHMLAQVGQEEAGVAMFRELGRQYATRLSLSGMPPAEREAAAAKKAAQRQQVLDAFGATPHDPEYALNRVADFVRFDAQGKLTAESMTYLAGQKAAMPWAFAPVTAEKTLGGPGGLPSSAAAGPSAGATGAARFSSEERQVLEGANIDPNRSIRRAADPALQPLTDRKMAVLGQIAGHNNAKADVRAGITAHLAGMP